MADDALVAVLGLQIGMLAEKVRGLGLDRFGQKGSCPVAQNFCELIVEDSWLNQMNGDLEKLISLAIADIFGVNSAESKREQSGIIRE